MQRLEDEFLFPQRKRVHAFGTNQMRLRHVPGQDSTFSRLYF
jgi:hypothetical protein